MPLVSSRWLRLRTGGVILVAILWASPSGCQEPPEQTSSSSSRAVGESKRAVEDRVERLRRHAQSFRADADEAIRSHEPDVGVPNSSDTDSQSE